MSPKPACGPELSSRRSLLIFESFIAVRLSAPGDRDEPAGVLGRVHEVRGGVHRQSGDLGEVLAGEGGVAADRVELGADRGTAEVHLEQVLPHFPQEFEVGFHRVGVGAERKPERHRHRVLHLRAAHRDDVSELRRFLPQRVCEVRERLEQAAQGSVQRDPQSRGVDVVR